MFTSASIVHPSAVTALRLYFSKKLLRWAEPKLYYSQFGQQAPLPANNGKYISFIQYAKLAIPTSTLTEGTAPTASTMSATVIDAVLDQWGAYVEISDLAVMTANHQLVQTGLRLLGTQAGELVDTEVRDVVVAGTNVVYANSKTARSALDANSYIQYADIIKAVVTLEGEDAMPFPDGNFVMICTPQQYGDIRRDTTWVNAATYSNVKALYNGEVGTIGSVRVVRTSQAPTVPSTVTVHQAMVIGMDAYAVSKFGGNGLETYIEQPGGVSDPLHQKQTLGWKDFFKATRLNENWMVRLESASRY